MPGRSDKENNQGRDERKKSRILERQTYTNAKPRNGHENDRTCNYGGVKCVKANLSLVGITILSLLATDPETADIMSDCINRIGNNQTKSRTEKKEYGP